MRRLAAVLPVSVLTLLLLAPVALANKQVTGGQGLYGETNDKVVTNAGFILIVAFPLFVATMSFIQWRLEKRKEARKAAAKARRARPEWRGGW
jgi:hypothetical protein